MISWTCKAKKCICILLTHLDLNFRVNVCQWRLLLNSCRAAEPEKCQETGGKLSYYE